MNHITHEKYNSAQQAIAHLHIFIRSTDRIRCKQQYQLRGLIPLFLVYIFIQAAHHTFDLLSHVLAATVVLDDFYTADILTTVKYKYDSITVGK